MNKLMTGVALAVGLSGGAAQAQEMWLGQIVPVGFNFCPRSTAEAAGQLLAISSHTALFSLYGTTYGGDGRTTFALPDLRGRVPIGTGHGPGLSDRREGARGGTETVTLSVNQMPNHTHSGAGTPTAVPTPGSSPSPAGNVPALTATAPSYAPLAGAKVDMAPNSVNVTIGAAGGGQAVSTMNPFLVIKYCVVMQGIYPSRS